MLTKRLEILFDPKEFNILKKKADTKGKSVACLIRETLKEKVIDSSLKQREKALKRLFSADLETPFDEWSQEKKMITKVRVEEIETH
ncbi:MAG: hypothetical protein ACUZ8E_08985 [Candidatus Anammoxibacter sp.]